MCVVTMVHQHRDSDGVNGRCCKRGVMVEAVYGGRGVVMTANEVLTVCVNGNS